MLSIIGLELLKIFSKWRTYIGFIALGLLLPLIHLAMFMEGETYIEVVTKTLQNNFNFSGNLLNGYMVTRIILQGLYLQIPFLIALVGGDLLAGEATSGTYRLLLIRPVSRLQIVISKYIAGLTYTFLMILFMAALSLGLGVMIFGTGDMLIVTSEITLLSASDVPWRFFATFAYAFLSMSVVYTISFFFSSLVENSIGPIMSTMAIIIVFTILNFVNVGILEYIQPLLFTNYMQSWRAFFDNPIDMNEIQSGIIALSLHIVLLAGFTFWHFNRRDINS